MKHSQTKLSGLGDDVLFFQSWWPTGTLRCLVLVVHGAAEHGGRYRYFADRVGQAGFAVAAIDLPGHGRSTGRRCCVDSFDTYIDAVARAKAQVLEEYRARSGDPAESVGTLPVVLLGHSMGGLVASLYVHHDADLVGAVFSGAATSVEPAPSALQLTLSRFLSKWFPSLGVLKLDAAGISRDPEIVTTYQQDPLVHNGKLSASLLTAMFVAMEQAKAQFAQVTLPVLILHGQADALVTPLASQRLYDGVSSGDKTLRLLPHLFHEIFNEPERDEVIDEVIEWIEHRLPAA